MARTCGLPQSLAFGDGHDLAARLQHLSQHPGALDELRATVSGLRAERTWSSIARRHLDLYDGLAA
jgi:hypothetical protein